MTETLNARPHALEPAAAQAPDPAETTYRLTISHGQFGVPEPLRLDGELPLSIGDEVNALVRIRITGRSEREPMSTYDRHTITTDAKIVEFMEVDGTSVPKPIVNDSTVTTAKKARRGDRVLYAFLGVCMTIASLSIIESFIQAVHH